MALIFVEGFLEPQLSFSKWSSGGSYLDISVKFINNFWITFWSTYFSAADTLSVKTDVTQFQSQSIFRVLSEYTCSKTALETNNNAKVKKMLQVKNLNNRLVSLIVSKLAITSKHLPE